MNSAAPGTGGAEMGRRTKSPSRWGLTMGAMKGMSAEQLLLGRRMGKAPVSRHETAWVALAAGLFHLALLGFLALVSRYGAGNTNAGPAFWSDALVHWDAHHYLRIAGQGYRDDFLLVFFPLFPLAIHTLSRCGLSLLEAALLINFVCHVSGASFFHRLVRLDHSPRTAGWALVFFLLFPASFVFVVPYSEPLSFLLVVSSVYCFRTRKHPWALVLAFLAGFSRATGWLLAPLLLTEFLMSRNARDRLNALSCVVAAPAGTLCYVAMNSWFAGDPLRFLEIQKQMFHRAFASPTAGLASTWAVLGGGWPEWLTIGVGNLAAVAMAWTAAFVTLLRGRKSYGVYCFCAALLITCQSRWLSALRYDSVLFPLFIMLAAGQRRTALRVGTGVVFLVALLFFAAQYAQGRWSM